MQGGEKLHRLKANDPEAFSRCNTDDERNLQAHDQEGQLALDLKDPTAKKYDLINDDKLHVVV